MSQALDPVTPHHVRQAADALADEFAGVFSRETIERYMAESIDLLGPSRVNVFVPVLLGAGVIVSGIAWVVERIGRATAGKSMERGLALKLESLAPPAAGLIAPDADPLSLFSPKHGRAA